MAQRVTALMYERQLMAWVFLSEALQSIVDEALRQERWQRTRERQERIAGGYGGRVGDGGRPRRRCRGAAATIVLRRKCNSWYPSNVKRQGGFHVARHLFAVRTPLRGDIVVEIADVEVIAERGEARLHISREAARPPSRVHPVMWNGGGKSRNFGGISEWYGICHSFREW